MFLIIVSAVKIFGVLTATQFLLAMIFYFKRPPRVERELHFFTVVVLGAVACHLIVFLTETPQHVSTAVVSGLLFSISSILFWSAILAHGRSHPKSVYGAIHPETIVTQGPYRYVRHPFYLAYLLGFCGSAALSGEWWLWIINLLVVWVYDRAARHEEQFLMSADSHLTEDYLAYIKKTRRWIPFVW